MQAVPSELSEPSEIYPASPHGGPFKRHRCRSFGGPVSGLDRGEQRRLR
jgi:hypothetical protein